MIWFGTGSPKPIVYTDSATLKSRHFTVEQLLVASVASKTYTLPTPTKDLAGKPTWFVNSSTGSQTLSGTFVGGSTETILTKTMVALICQPQSPGVYKWVAFGNTAAITGLRETVEDYCAGLFTTGTQVGLTITYDDSGAAESIAIIYGAASDITDTGTTSTDKLAGAVAGKAANAGHKHALGAHTHVDATTGGAIAHTALTAIGTNTHAQVDSHIVASGASVHGLGTMATQNAASVAITGGTITGVAVTGVTDLTVPDGGTGCSTLTDGGILLGSGAAAITALGQATNGQIPIGSTGLDPVLGTITAGTGIAVTNTAGAISIATDLKTNGGLVIETNDLSVDLSASAITGTLGVADGGTGAQTLTSHGIMLGNGVGAVAILAEATNGQIPIGATGANPTLALPTGSEGITVTGASGALAFKVTDDGITLAKMAHGVSRGMPVYAGGTFDPTLLAAPTTGYVLKGAGATADLAFGLVGLDSITSGSAYAAWTPALTWINGLAPASVTTVARWMRRWSTVEFDFDSYGADGDDRVLRGFTLPVATAATASKPFVAFQVVNVTYGVIYARLLTAAEVALNSTVGDVLGADLVADGNMSANTGWTEGADWLIGAGVATKTTGTANGLQQNTWQPAVGARYRLTFTTTVTTPGTLAIGCGGVVLTPRTTADTFIEDFTAVSDAKLIFTSDAAWAGTLDNVSVVQIARGGTATEAGVIFGAATTCTNSVAWRIRVSGFYEVV